MSKWNKIENDHFLKWQLETEGNYEMKPKTKTTEIQKAMGEILSTREIPSVQQVATQQQTTKVIILSNQSSSEGQIELLKLGLTFTCIPIFEYYGILKLGLTFIRIPMFEDYGKCFVRIHS